MCKLRDFVAEFARIPTQPLAEFLRIPLQNIEF